MTKKTNRLILIFGLALLLVLPLAVQAGVKKAGENVYLPSSEVHEGNFYAGGNAVEIAGTVNGDVFAAGNSITISGTVNGDVFAAGSNIRVSGDVDGSVRAAGSNVSFDGKVSRNIMAGGSTLIISETAEVGRHVTLAGAVVDVRGKVGGNLEIAGNTANIATEVGGDTYVKIDGQLKLLPQASLQGDLNYKAMEEISAEETELVAGETVYNALIKKPKKAAILGFIAVGYFFGKLVQLFSLFIVGLVIIYLGGKKIKEMTNLMIEKPGAQIGRGAVWFFLTPIACVILLITVIGIPLALIIGVSYAVVLYLSKVFAAIALGILLAKGFGWEKFSLILKMVIGVIAFVIIKSIPIVGWLICLVAIWWGLGAIVEMKKRAWKEMKE
ncbi:polymer-forming cytoskeletal protein [Patescibacteria group bacterium]|nr:polymer-forming cytoskeletal protein [Patescibacteria group bacterium]